MFIVTFDNFLTRLYTNERLHEPLSCPSFRCFDPWCATVSSSRWIQAGGGRHSRCRVCSPLLPDAQVRVERYQEYVNTSQYKHMIYIIFELIYIIRADYT